jgi:hypothetical protein
VNKLYSRFVPSAPMNFIGKDTMKFLMTCTLLALAATATARPPEETRTATVKMASRSIRLGEATGETSTSMAFSTLGAGARFFGNGEFRPSSTRAGSHESAYTAFDGETRVETGTIFVPLPATDANGNGIADVVDFEAAVDITVEGEVIAKGSTSGDPVSLHLQRSAGSDTGNYTLTAEGGPILTGSYSVLHSEGTVEYQRTDAGALLNFDVSNATTNAHAVSRVADANNVRLAAFRFRVSGTRTVRVGPTELERNGSVYQGDTALTDGLTETLVPDYRAWILQITDTNDRNADGVPDFSDMLPPYIKVQPVRKIVPTGSDVVLSVTVESSSPLTFEWQQNGHELSNSGANATTRVLVLPSATIDDKGSYRVRVSNAAGTVWSDSTSVSFIGQ